LNSHSKLKKFKTLWLPKWDNFVYRKAQTWG